MIALIVLTFVVFTRELGRLSELFITRNASPDTILRIAAALLPGILIFSLPLAFFIGTLIGLGGLAAESQITALRACGVPLSRMLRPILLVALVAGATTAWLSLVILHSSNDKFYNLRDRISLRQATSQIQARVFNEDFPSIVFYLDDLAADRQHWSRVILWDSLDPQSPKTVLAREGTWVTDEDAIRVQLHLREGTIYQVDPGDSSRTNVSQFASTDIPLQLNGAPGRRPESGSARKPRKVFELSTVELWGGAAPNTDASPLEQKIELQRRLAIPFSVVCFALLSLPLAAGTRKSGRTAGFVMSMIFVLLFYVLLMNGLRLASVGTIPPWLGAWGANVFLGIVGLALFICSERRGWRGSGFAEWSWKLRLASIARAMHLKASRARAQRIDQAILTSTGRIARLFSPKTLDLYLSRGFVYYFLWSAFSCSALFVILTLFDLLDDIIRNGIAAGHVIDYFFFLLPQILLLVVPMSILLAVLIHFGILEKASEITAIKAGGWSLYRICLPIILLSSLICVGMYLLQDYVLPYANIRQDSIRNLIKGRPAQTMRPQRKWIFGESNRIFNYDYFDSSQDMFVGLNIYEIDFSRLKILRRIYADKASIRPGGVWLVENGWIHDYRPEETGFRRLQKAELAFPERAAYFKKEIFEPKESSKLTFVQLRQYISYLSQAGYNATELRVELHKKISFPMSCLIMALLGVPFAFSMGRKGAFFGIAASIAIAITYWGVFSVFEQMGAYGLLIPLLAAWAPNILFGAAGLALLLTIRT